MTKRSEGSWLVVLLNILLVLPCAAWMGFVIQRLWGWFVAPLGVPRIGVWHAAGLALLVGLLTRDWARDLTENERTAGERLVRAIGLFAVIPALTLAFGAIYHTLGS